MEFLSLVARLGHRWSNELRGWLPTISVENRGPAVAEDVTVTVRRPEPGPGPRITHGPYDAGRLAPGEEHTSDLTMRAPDDVSPASVEVRWRDPGGKHARTDHVDPPEPPAAGKSTRSLRPRL